MDKDIIDRPFIDGNFVSYEKFFDHEWCKRIFDAVEISPLADAVNTLIVAWRSTNGAHILPRLMAESLRAFADGGLDGNLRCRANYSDKVVKGLVGKLVERMQYHLNFDQRSALKGAVSKIEEEAHQAQPVGEPIRADDGMGEWLENRRKNDRTDRRDRVRHDRQRLVEKSSIGREEPGYQQYSEHS